MSRVNTYNIYLTLGDSADPRVDVIGQGVETLLARLEKQMDTTSQIAEKVTAVLADEEAIKAGVQKFVDQQTLINTLRDQIAALTAADATQEVALEAILANANKAKDGADAIVAMFPADPPKPVEPPTVS